jgi:hypothetical protein
VGAKGELEGLNADVAGDQVPQPQDDHAAGPAGDGAGLGGEAGDGDEEAEGDRP